MLIPKEKSPAHYRLQAAHIREFLETVRNDDQLRTVLLDAIARLDQLAEELERSASMRIKDKAPNEAHA